MVMISHAFDKKLDPIYPSSLSKIIIPCSELYS